VIFDLCGLFPFSLVNFCEYSSNQRGNASIVSRMFCRTRIVALERTFIIKWTNKSRKMAVIFDLAGIQVFAFFSLNFDPIGMRMVPFDFSNSSALEFMQQNCNQLDRSQIKVEKLLWFLNLYGKNWLFTFNFLNIAATRVITRSLCPDDHSALNECSFEFLEPILSEKTQKTGKWSIFPRV